MRSQLIDPSGLVPVERDACAIICFVNKAARPTHGNVQRTIDALIKMGHRAGEIDGEGDGCGILTDIPRLLWREVLAEAGHSAAMADDPGFAVGHLLIPRELLGEAPDIRETIQGRLAAAGAELLVERPGPVRSEVLAARAREGEPLFWQIAGYSEAPDLEKRLELKTMRREKKKKPKMAVQGKRVFQIVALHAKRRKRATS